PPSGSRRWLEAPFEPAPRELVGVEEVADVRATRRDRRPRGAVVVGGVCVADNGAVADDAGEGGGRRPVGLAGDQVEGAGRGRSEGGPVRVVAHGEVLGVVPQRGDGVAVVVVHDEVWWRLVRWRARLDLSVLDELVHQAVI